MNIASIQEKSIKRTIVTGLYVGALAVNVHGVSRNVHAAPVNECGGVSTNIIQCGNTGGDPVTDLLLQVVNFLAIGVGIAVVAGIIWGGLVYASSNGDSNKVQQAKTIIVNAVIGLLLFFFMYALINYLVPGGLFT